jgi:hypothetical protein
MADRTKRLSLLALCLAAVAVVPAGAVDGVILIDQNRALAGGVSPGDTPGFPVTISVKGSYKLSSNLTVNDVNTTAIMVTGTASMVTIDLNGFSITGPVTCSISPTVCNQTADNPNDIFGPGVGIHSVAQESVTIKNGSIRGMGRYGIFLAGAPISIIDQVQVMENGLGGMWPSAGLILNSTATQNGGFGIQTNQGVIKGSFVSRNAGDGIVSTGFQITIQDSFIHLNGGFGINFTSAGGAIGNNIISGNSGGAIDGNAIETTGNYCVGTGCP